MDIYTAAIVVSLIVYVAIGNYAGRRVKKLDDYYVAGRNAPTILIVGTLVASYISTAAFLGETGFVYDGYAGTFILWPGIATAFYVYGALFFGRYLRRSRAITVADYFGKRFNSRKVQTVAGLTIILGLAGYLLAVTQGAAYLLSQVIDVEIRTALLVVWASYTIFTMYAGSKGVILTDTLMFLLFSGVAVVVMVYLVDDAGGMSRAVYDLASLPEKPGLMSWSGAVGEGFDFSSPAHLAAWNVTMAFGWGLVAAVSPWQSGRYLIARDEHVVMRAGIIGAVCILILYVGLSFAAAVINLSDSGITPSEQVMIYAARNLVPTLLGAVLLAGIMAAALSSASTFLSLVGFSISNDIFSHESVSEEKMLRISRLTMLGTGLVVLVVAFFSPIDVFWLTYFVGTLYASSWGPVGLMSVWSKRITADAAFWGIISGFVFNAGPKGLEMLGWIELPFWLHPLLLGGLVSLIVVLALSRTGTVSREERLYRMRMHRTPEADRDPAKSRITRRIPIIMVIYTLALTVIYLVAYVPPYQAATGTDALGEIIVIFTGPVLWIGTAVLAWWMIRKSYG